MKVAVIGTGTVGPSIAQVFAQCDEIEHVFLCKGRDSSKRDGKESLVKIYDRLVEKGKLNRLTTDAYLNKIETGGRELATGADYVIEAVVEDLQVKQELFRELDAICGMHTAFATNTSSLSVSAIGEGLSRPLVGMHFFNPPPVMKLVEVIATKHTPQEVVCFAVDLTIKIGKTPLVVQEAPGFVVNRILIPMINEAIGIFADGIASAEDIDTAMKLGANHPIGPLALGDLIGLDVVLSIMETLLRETGDTKYLPHPLLKKMVGENKLGKKTGEGFYLYQ